MSQILLVRHGQASWGSDDYDVLSPLGEKQSRVLGEALAARGVRPDLVLRGAMRRHRQTAEQAAAGGGWDAVVVEDDGWNEFDHVQMLSMHPSRYGEGEEMSRAEFQKWFEEATLRWTGGAYDEDYDESFSAFGERVDAALRRTVERLEPNQTAVVFTSGGPISWVATSLLGGSADIWTQLNPVTVNSSVTKVVVGRRGATMVSFNDHSHLETAGDGFITYR
ncbi:MAG TPA: histidine phosphatase family protein [Nocardioidaceae bacterium]|nr:histidine phosphatase family protein [Nocardioidaceae bacterium]